MSENENSYDSIKAQVDVATWEMLEPHFKKDVVIIVSNRLDLVEVALAVTNDDTEAVTKWLEEGQIYKPTAENFDEWSQEPQKNLADIIVVHPYVLIQLVNTQLH